MISLDKALGDYTDLINEKKDINLKDFKYNLSKEDYEEFLELIDIIQIGKSLKISKKFNEVFSELNEYKNSIYNTDQQACNFRKSSNIKDKDIEDKINKIFDMEFNEDHEE